MSYGIILSQCAIRHRPLSADWIFAIAKLRRVALSRRGQRTEFCLAADKRTVFIVITRPSDKADGRVCKQCISEMIFERLLSPSRLRRRDYRHHRPSNRCLGYRNIFRSYYRMQSRSRYISKTRLMTGHPKFASASAQVDHPKDIRMYERISKLTPSL